MSKPSPKGSPKKASLQTWSPEDSHAPRFREPANREDRQMSDGSGPKCTEFARFSDQTGYWLKTSQGYSQRLMQWDDKEASSEEFLEIWPRSGILSNGIASQLPSQPARPTSETESGSWPTPNTLDYLDPRDTSTIEAYNNNRDGRQNRKALSNLRQAVVSPHYENMFPTPTTQDADNNAGPSQFKRNSLPLNAVAGGKLNPVWVEWLMGYPEGWTDCEDSEMQ